MGISLSLSYSDAGKWAQEWTQEYPCSAADSFAKVAKDLQSTAISAFSKSYSEASAFAREQTPKLCEIDDMMAKQAREYQSYGISSLSMSYSEASKYSERRIKERYFGCDNGDVFKHGRGKDDSDHNGRGRRDGR